MSLEIGMSFASDTMMSFRNKYVTVAAAVIANMDITTTAATSDTRTLLSLKTSMKL